jgi:hypothetical protein
MLKKASDLMDKNFWTWQYFLGIAMFLTGILEDDIATVGIGWVVTLIGVLGNEVRQIKGKE